MPGEPVRIPRKNYHLLISAIGENLGRMQQPIQVITVICKMGECCFHIAMYCHWQADRPERAIDE